MEPKAARMNLIRDAMPGVAAQVRGYRAEWGDAHVTACIARGMAGEAGWFFAREGAIAIGTPWEGDPVLSNFAAAQVSATQALVVMRKPGAADGTH